ncbi:5'-AMP-activated protein kinase subunit beta-1b [Pangasianodon hypophthalmus]|nr:5'-AMP-activated protein kinase subunit beta-1b [Pangasianodon hypophthalmus]XP_034162674.1 5'-AMP-activated protein kinase subunit beta-1b [Pangasianodon hypophthalmus]XP_034162675.1 5'-AMP-activated protein kinase subunit beta-1b [Pangasianodon hypophthalmus]
MGNASSERSAQGEKSQRSRGGKDAKILLTDDSDLFQDDAKEFLAWQKDVQSGNKCSVEHPTVFEWSGPARDVYLSGSFNNWATKIPLNKSHNNFTGIINLPEGEHQYKFHVDGHWTLDPKKPVVTTKSGIVNNVVLIRKTDFEVFDALNSDSEICADVSDISGSPPGPYHQDPYSFRAEERLRSPPILPPHLLQVLLNKDTGVSCDPALLPEPNHVMLNHLYALSIKDGVMVLSATHRYKKKYVTTLLYKPI